MLYIWDPNPEMKKHKVKTEEFRKEWTGNIMFFSNGIMQEV